VFLLPQNIVLFSLPLKLCNQNLKTQTVIKFNF
jgi:hypothetical protein